MLMKTLATRIALVLLSAPHRAPAQANVAPPRERDLYTAAMLECAGLPCVEVSIGDGKHLRLAIDTGNPTSILTLKAANALAIKQEPYLGRDGKAVPGVSIAKLPSLGLGNGNLGELRFAVADLAPAIKSGTFPDVDGTLAYGAFKNRVLQMNYRERTVGFSGIDQGSPSCPASLCSAIRLISFGKNGPPIVTVSGFSVSGKALDVQVDTMFSGALLVYPTAVDKLDLSTQSLSKTVRYFPYTDEGVDMMEARGVTENFGTTVLMTNATVYFAGPRVHLPDGLFEGTVGAELFRGHILTFDFKAMQFSIS